MRNAYAMMSLYKTVSGLVRTEQISMEDAADCLGISEELLVRLMAEEEIQAYLSGEMKEAAECAS